MVNQRQDNLVLPGESAMHDQVRKPKLSLNRQSIKLDEKELEEVQGGGTEEAAIKVDQVYVTGGVRW